MSQLKKVAAEMRKLAFAGKSGSPTFRTVQGWTFGLSYGPVPIPPREVFDRFKGDLAKRLGLPELASYDEVVAASEKTTHVVNDWVFSASLHPRGRSSTEVDWRLLGQ